MTIDISFNGFVGIRFEGDIPPSAKEYVRKELGHMQVKDLDEPDIIVRFIDRMPIRVPPDSEHYFGDGLYILQTHLGTVEVPYYALENFPQSPILIRAERSVSPYFLFTRVVEQFADFIMTTYRGVTFVHASSVSVNGKGAVFAALPHTGKTDLLLGFLLNGWGRFLGDDFTIISQDGTIYPYPRQLNILHYNVHRYPELLRHMYSNWSSIPQAKIKLLIGQIGEWARQKRGNFWRGLALVTLHASHLKGLDVSKVGGIAPPTSLSTVFLTYRSARVREPVFDRNVTPEKIGACLTANQIWERESLWSDYMLYIFASKGYKSSLVEGFRRKKEELLAKAFSRSTNYILTLSENTDPHIQASFVRQVIECDN